MFEVFFGFDRAQNWSQDKKNGATPSFGPPKSEKCFKRTEKPDGKRLLRKLACLQKLRNTANQVFLHPLIQASSTLIRFRMKTILSMCQAKTLISKKK